jgi:hypothetical protein
VLVAIIDRDSENLQIVAEKPPVLGPFVIYIYGLNLGVMGPLLEGKEVLYV